MQKGWLARFLRHQGAVCGDKSILVPPYLRTLVPPIILFALFFLSSCRRDLWVYTDELRQVELITDWSEATEVPDGMTWWFMNDNLSGQNRHNKTSDVTHTWLALPRGTFTGIIFDYSPEEYAHIEFLGMTRPDKALAHLPAAADQPLPDDELYGPKSVPYYLHGVPLNPEGNGMYLISSEPELMNADTLFNVVIKTGVEDDLILWDEREKYETTLETQTIEAQPHPIVWQLHVKVAVKGLQYMYSVRASVAGLADGCWLSTLRHTSTPCLQALDNWQTQNAWTDRVGYITTSVHTFGLIDTDMPPSSESTFLSRSGEVVHYDEHLRLNLQFMLRDRQTVLNYHFDLGSDCITVEEDQLIVNIDIPIDYPEGIPDLPYVDEVDASGFDATVTPWADGGTADTTM